MQENHFTSGETIMLLPIALSVIACIGWGLADFIGGLKAKKIPVLSILTISTVTGLVLLSFITFGTGQGLPNDPDLLWAAAAGPIGVTAMFLLYSSLSVGNMSILAPVSATGVILPVLWGLFHGDAMSGLSFLGIVIAVFGSLLAVMEKQSDKNRRKLTRGVGLALGSALFVGLYFIAMDTACTTQPVWASFIMRCTTLVCLIPVLFATRTKINPGKPHWPVILFMGTADTLAAFCFAMATSGGMLSQVAVISSMYPAVTVMLSAWILKERMARIQAAGVLLAITGVVLISAF